MSKQQVKAKQLHAQFFRKNKGNLTVAIFVALLNVAANLILSWLLKAMMDTVEGNAPYPVLFLLGIGILLCGIVFLCGFGEYVFKTRFIAKATKQYREYAFSRLLKKRIQSFSKENTSTYLSVLSNDLNAINTQYLSKIPDLIFQVGVFVGALGMMLWYSPLLTAVGIGFSLLPVVASLALGNRLAPAEKALSERNERYTGVLKDALSGFSVIKSFKAEEAIGRLFHQHNETLTAAAQKRDKTAVAVSSVANLAGLVAQLGVFFVAAVLAAKNMGVTSGTVVIFVQLMNFVIGPIATLPTIFSGRKASMALIDKLATLLTENAEEGEERRGKEVTAQREIRLNGVTYAYPGDKPVIKDLSLTFSCGKSYAVVGASGSGKSTLLNLLTSSYPDYSGEILFDGKELKSIDTDALYNLISVIQQNVFIFNGSIYDNITMFSPFDEEKVNLAVERSGLKRLVEEKGYGYLCGEGGCALSGGEKQRIAIARSLLRDTPVLLVDEATSALDKNTENEVNQALFSLKELTKIMVTHTLSEKFLRSCDEIVVLKEGGVYEKGDFEELMAKKDYFYSLYTVSRTSE